MYEGELPVSGGQCPFLGVLVGVVNTICRRSACVLDRRRSSASWLNAQSLLHTGHHCDGLGPASINRKQFRQLGSSEIIRNGAIRQVTYTTDIINAA